MWGCGLQGKHNIMLTKLHICVGVDTQGGKSWLCIDRTKYEVEQDDIDGTGLTMVFTMKLLDNTSQFADRLKSFEREYGVGSVCTLASKKVSDYTNVKTLLELKGLCCDQSTRPKVVVMCSHTKRFKDGIDFANFLNDNSHIGIQRVFLHYDELHEYITPLLCTQIQQLNSLPIVNAIWGYSATPTEIFEYWPDIQTLYLQDITFPNYAGASDMTYVTVDDFYTEPYKRPGTGFELRPLADEHMDYLSHTLKKHPEILGDGARRVFLPAHKLCESHGAVRDLVWEHSPRAAVVVLNGKDKTLKYNDGGVTKTIQFSSMGSEELSKKIAKVVHDYRLTDRLLVITGFLCIGMGQTFMDESIGSFDYAVLGHMDLTNSAIYQLFGRVTGRMKHWDKYIKTQVYCPTTIMNRCMAQHLCCQNAATNHNGTIMNKQEYLAPMIRMGEAGRAAISNIRPRKPERKVKVQDTDRAHEMCNSEKEALEFVNKLGLTKLYKRKNGNIAPADWRAYAATTRKGLHLEGIKGNPTKEMIMKRFQGCKPGAKEHQVRMVPTDMGNWVVYWRPSFKTQ